jgi:hypothetical protein
MRVPQCPQNGSAFSAFLLHRGQRDWMTGARTGDEVFAVNAVGGTAARAAVAEPDAFATVDAWTSLPAVAAPLLTPTWAAEAVIGFPQSMQNREVASFSRPQKAHAVNRHPPRRENLMGREYRTAPSERQLSISWGQKQRASRGRI